MVINSNALLAYHPIKDMLGEKVKEHGVSHGLSEAGYDIRIKQEIRFTPANNTVETLCDGEYDVDIGRFIIASSMEEFDMPTQLMGIVHDKSTWARRGLSVFNTVIEPGWKGFLTLELVYHGQQGLVIPAGSGIAQVIFHKLEVPSAYSGKYQNQEDRPVSARHS